MQLSLRRLQTIWIALLGSVVFYFVVCLFSPAHSGASPQMLWVLLLSSAVIAGTVFVLRGKVLTPAATLAATQPDDAKALSLWRSAHIVIWALCEVVAMYGLVLHFLGFRTFQTTPFFAGAFLLILLFAPQRPKNVNAI